MDAPRPLRNPASETRLPLDHEGILWTPRGQFYLDTLGLGLYLIADYSSLVMLVLGQTFVLECEKLCAFKQNLYLGQPYLQPDQLLYLWDLLLAYDTMEVFPLLASTVLRYQIVTLHYFMQKR